MRSFSDSVFLILPGLLAVVLLAFFAAPLRVGGVSLCPNVGMLATLIVVSSYPAAWPRWFAFLFGLFQDMVFATPLGVHALLLLLMVSVGERLGQRGNFQFRVRWFDVAGFILAWHVLLWIVLHLIHRHAPSLLMVGNSAVVTILWYPVFYFLFTRTSRVA